MKDDIDLVSQISGLIDACELDDDTNDGRRQRALDYYNGVMGDLVPDKGYSSVVSKDVRAAMKKVMPSVMRIFFGTDDMVIYKPTEPGEEDAAESAALYVNRVVMPESQGDAAVFAAAWDACMLGEGFLKWWWERKRVVVVKTHTGITAEQKAQVEADPDNEILSSEEYEGTILDQVVTLYDCRVKRVEELGSICIEALAPEDVGVHPSTGSNFKNSPMVFHRVNRRRSELVALGYDKDVVFGLPEAENIFDDENEDARDPQRRFGIGNDSGLSEDMEEVEVFECFAPIDLDGDGIAELREIHFVKSGDASRDAILFNDYAEECRIACVLQERRPHTWRGHSIFDDIEDVQRIKTAMFRSMIDNVLQTMRPTPVYAEGSVVDPEPIYNPAIGKPIVVKRGSSVVDAVTFVPRPVMIEGAMAISDKADANAVERTGITSASAGLDPNALQNVREQGVQMVSDAATASIWMMCRTLAQTIAPVFAGILKLVKQHQDIERQIQLDGEWTAFDPKTWNENFGVEVDIGLGTGSKERDLVALQNIAGLQEKILGFEAAVGLQTGIVQPTHIFNLAKEITKAAGLRDWRRFFQKPDEEVIAAQVEEKRNQPSPDQQKLEMQAQLEQMKMDAQRDKEAAQAEADVLVKRAEMERDAAMMQREAEMKAEDRNVTVQLELAKLQQQRELKIMELQQAERLARLSKGEEVGEQDAETGEIKLTPLEQVAQLMATIAQQNAQTQAMLREMIGGEKVTELIRDENGRPAGSVTRMAPISGMVN